MGDTLVIGDLHIGVEAHMGAKGVHLVSHTDDMFDAIVDAAGAHVDRIVMIGDVKDSVPGSTKQEYREIPRFFDRLLDRFSEVDIVRGNHDTSIEEFVPAPVGILPATGAVIDGVGLIHGHTWPSEEIMSQKVLVMGHEHPVVMFKDGVGAHMSEPCWLRGRFNAPDGVRYRKVPESFILVPAFNRMLGGSPINVNGSSLLSPLLNSGMADLDDAHVYLLDGIDLGRRADLMVDDRRYRRWDDREDRPRHTSLRLDPGGEVGLPLGGLRGLAVAVADDDAVDALVDLGVDPDGPEDLRALRILRHLLPPVYPACAEVQILGGEEHVLDDRRAVEEVRRGASFGQDPDERRGAVERVSVEVGADGLAVDPPQPVEGPGVGDHYGPDGLPPVSRRGVHARLEDGLEVAHRHGLVRVPPAAPSRRDGRKRVHGEVRRMRS